MPVLATWEVAIMRIVFRVHMDGKLERPPCQPIKAEGGGTSCHARYPGNVNRRKMSKLT
jgi:hypothetical protein